MQALTDVFGPPGRPAGPCWLGAVKSNIGHTGAAAGVAGLIKTALMLEHRELVPTLHYAAPNPLLELDLTPFQVSTATRPWPGRPGGGAPLAAVSSFGLGGTNAHVVLTGAPRRATPASRPGPRLLALSAASTDALHRLRGTMATRLDSGPAAHRAGGGAHAGRAPVVLPPPGVRRRRPRRGRRPAAGRRRPGSGRPARQVAFLFPGQGTLRTAAGAAAYRLLPGFRACFDEIRDTVAAAYGLDLAPVVAEEGAPEEWFRDTVHQQLGLFALGCGLARQLGDWRIRPAVMLGNSIGEYVAATLAGTWTVADGARLVHQRARAMWDTEPGLMASVAAPAAEVRRRIGPDGAVPVAVASPGAAVVSGARADMERLLAGDALHGLDVRRLDVERAFHCATMDPAAEVLRAAVAAVPSRRPAGRLVSNSTGDYADPDALRTPAYWAAHLRRPVLLDASMRVLLDSGCETYLELGPGSSMIAALRRSEGLGPRPHDRADARPGRRRGTRTAAGARHALGARRRYRARRPRRRRRGPLLAAGAPVRRPRPGRGRRPGAARAARAVPGPAPPRRPGDPRPRALRQVLERAWCAALGVPSAAAGDDFVALGGESLTAVDLLSRVHEETGLSVSVTEFSAAATFGALVRLVERERSRPGQLAVRAVALAEDRPGRPLFLAADAAGNALSYRPLAAELDGPRPVIGLEPTDPGATGLSIEDSAARHVEAVRAAQPSGPYTLGGWSFGAVLAHEMACRLAAEGEEVDALVCLDAFVPGRAGRPVGLDPGFLADSLRLQAGAALHIGAAGRQVRRSPGLRRLLLAKSRVLARYRPDRSTAPRWWSWRGCRRGRRAACQDD